MSHKHHQVGSIPIPATKRNESVAQVRVTSFESNTPQYMGGVPEEGFPLPHVPRIESERGVNGSIEAFQATGAGSSPAVRSMGGKPAC